MLMPSGAGLSSGLGFAANTHEAGHGGDWGGGGDSGGDGGGGYDPFGPISDYPPVDTPTPDYPGRQSGVDNTNNILGILGATATSIVKAITGNYPPLQQPYGTTPHPVTYNAANPNNVGGVVANSAGQTVSQATRFLTNNLGTVVIAVVAYMLFKSGRK